MFASVSFSRLPLPFLGLLLAAGGLACIGGGGSGWLVGGGSGGEPPASVEFSAFDLEGSWRGWSEPFNPFDQRLELTLGFEAYGAANNAVALREYSFASPLNGEHVDYLSLLDGYDLLFFANGRLSLDTVFRSYMSGGVWVEERVYKDMQMNDARDRIEGGETIEVYENGRLTIYYQGWLTLERLD